MQDESTSSSSSPAPVLIFSLEIPVLLPSWNQILGMHHWQRAKFKGELASGFLSALRASVTDSSTKTTCAKSTTSIYADTLELYIAMLLSKRKSKSAKSRLAKKIKSAR